MLKGVNIFLYFSFGIPRITLVIFAFNFSCVNPSPSSLTFITKEYTDFLVQYITQII
jgi:hypothetical protein